MMNIITSEFYKILKSKVFYGIIAVLLVFNAIFLGNNIYIRNSSSYTPEQKAQMIMPGVAGYQSSFGGNIIFYIILIFIASLITAEYTNGSIRQMSCHGFPRWKLILGQYISMSLVITALLIVFALINTIYPTILYGFGNIDAIVFLRANLGLLCVFWGVSGIGTFLSYLIRSGAGTIGACLLIIMCSNLALQLVAYLTKNESIAKYTLDNMKSIIADFASTPHDVGFYSMIFIAIGMVTVLGSCLLFTKRDVD